jgi:hypothetical protein
LRGQIKVSIQEASIFVSFGCLRQPACHASTSGQVSFNEHGYPLNAYKTWAAGFIRAWIFLKDDMPISSVRISYCPDDFHIALKKMT